MPTSFSDRLAGGLLGLLVGDALGVPYEFHPASDLPPAHLLEFTPPAEFRRSHAEVLPGTWSDDGAQALALLASLLGCGRLDPEDLGRRLVGWYEKGEFAVGGLVFDVGIQTAQALRRLQAGVPALTAGPDDESANGNGSLMRALPLALWHLGSDEELVRDAHAQSCVTHRHLRSQVCCAVYCLWARRTLRAADRPWEEAVASLRQVYGSGSAAWAELAEHVRPEEPPAKGTGGGYVVDCLCSARWALATGAGYEDVVKRAVGLGEDTDTTACVAGGIAGLRGGLEEIPARWRNQLRGRDIFEPLLSTLTAHHASGGSGE